MTNLFGVVDDTGRCHFEFMGCRDSLNEHGSNFITFNCAFLFSVIHKCSSFLRCDFPSISQCVAMISGCLFADSRIN